LKQGDRNLKNKSNLYSYLLCALFAELTALFSQIMVPLPFTPVPVNLALLAVWMAGGVLGARKGALAIAVFILLGAVGVPVFHGLQGGLGVLAGPTGGYIIGYLPSVIIFGLLRGARNYEKNTGGAAQKVLQLLSTITVGLPAMAACYALGTAWFIISTGTGFVAAMLMCVIPFIPGDLLKLVAAAAVCESLRKPLRALG
jgi:biotin transport system substrate-specific component